jgi:hypothetical protein
MSPSDYRDRQFYPYRTSLHIQQHGRLCPIKCFRKVKSEHHTLYGIDKAIYDKGRLVGGVMI